MNEKYATLSLVQLKELAKSQGVKNVSTMRKAQLVQLMGELEEKYNREKNESREEQNHREKSDVREEKSRREKSEVREEKSHREKSEVREEKSHREKGEIQEEKRMDHSAESSGDGADMRMDSSLESLDSGQIAHGILEVLSDGYGFIRCENYLPGPNDVYVSPAQIRRFNMKTGDIIAGNIRVKTQNEKFSALLYVRSVNGMHPGEATRRMNFEDMTPIFPEDRIRLETVRSSVPMRIMETDCQSGNAESSGDESDHSAD